MSDDLTPASNPAQATDTGAASGSSSESTTSVPADTRAIAASVFAQDAGDTPAAPPPADPSISSTPPDAATRVEEDDDPEYRSLLASGSMPVDRHKAVLTNARRKTREEVERAARARYGWVDDLKVDRARTEHALGLMQALDANPEQAIRTLAHALGINLTPPPTPEPTGPPPPDVRLDDGSEFYSAAQLTKLQAWQNAEYDKKLATLEERYKPLIEDRHLSKLRTLAAEEATTTLAECRSTWPQFGALETDIKARMLADPALSLDRAYIKAFAAKGFPALQQQQESDRAGQLQRKAAASNPGPGAARPVTPLRYAERSTRDIAAEVFARSR
jgi:hypothetical protein